MQIYEKFLILTYFFPKNSFNLPLGPGPSVEVEYINRSLTVLKKDSHKHWQECCCLIFPKVFGINKVAVADSV